MRAVDAQAVSDGRSVRWTLERIYREQPGRVRVDWLRFTVPLDAVVKRDKLLAPDTNALSLMDAGGRDLVRLARGADAGDYTGAMAVSHSAARTVSEMLGVFEPGACEDKGMDFYTARTPFLHNGETVGHALAGGKSTAQSGTVHINLHGRATLHVSHEKWGVIANWLDEVGGTITRVDLSLDIFEGLDMSLVQQAWKDGEFDVRGKRPKQREIGAWSSGHSRTFEVGRRETGKVCRIYEKGDEQFGDDANDPWVRVECEFRSNHRVIDSDVLRNPADFFAGASKFCADIAALHECDAEPTSIKTLAAEAGKLIALTAEASASRVTKWLDRTVGACYRSLVDHAPESMLISLYDRNAGRVPKRLRGYSSAEMVGAFQKVAAGLAPSPAPFANGAA